MSELDLDKLETLARAADADAGLSWSDHGALRCMAFSEAASTSVVLALIDRVRLAEKRVRVLEGLDADAEEAVRLNNEAHRRRFEACKPTALARGIKVRDDHEIDSAPLEVLIAEEIEHAVAAARKEMGR